MPVKLSRRQILKSLSMGAASIPLSSLEFGELDEKLRTLDPFAPMDIDKPVTAIVIGAGNRGNVYGNFAVQYPKQLDIVGVAEPIPIRNERHAAKHDIKPENRFRTWEDVFEKPKFADAVIISTPDNLHYGPCIAALKAGYDVLLEKPISPSEQECRDILKQAKQSGRIVAVCHVLRYAPYFIRLRMLMQSGAIGKVISIQHLEPIHHVHMSHSYVRGNWHNSKATTPIILAKSCHDLDIMKWMLGKQSKQIHAFADLNWFRKENTPAGSTDRCTAGCAIESECPYSALRIYYRNRTWLHHFDLPEEKEKQGEAILKYLETTNYGRCVYRMENDQPDHYTVNILFDDNITAAFSMEAFTSYEGRRTRVMGSMGDIAGDMNSFTLTDFRNGSKTKWEQASDTHGGGDWRLVADWVQAVSKKDPSLLTSTIDDSIESHIMGFAAETSRKQGKVVPVEM